MLGICNVNNFFKARSKKRKFRGKVQWWPLGRKLKWKDECQELKRKISSANFSLGGAIFNLLGVLLIGHKRVNILCCIESAPLPHILVAAGKISSCAINNMTDNIGHKFIENIDHHRCLSFKRQLGRKGGFPDYKKARVFNSFKILYTMVLVTTLGIILR